MSKIYQLQRAATPSVRILVVGDRGVGKSTLINLLCHNETLRSPSWTVGCYADATIYECSNAQYFIEFIEIAKSSHPRSRQVFYRQNERDSRSDYAKHGLQSVHGVILVHDTNNRKSYGNLWKYASEILRTDQTVSRKSISKRDYVIRRNNLAITLWSFCMSKWAWMKRLCSSQGQTPFNGKEYSDIGSHLGTSSREASGLEDDFVDMEEIVGSSERSIPVLIVGTKTDISASGALTGALGHDVQRGIEIEFGADRISMTNAPAAKAQYTERFNAFYDKVIQRSLKEGSRIGESYNQNNFETFARRRGDNSAPLRFNQDRI
ncbi:hypothetical protein BJ742DRAFT_24981 [Cladochytrium replicatum]|nr:hypothetical protein BJ742DRAFT_24981 [Cladochytrium replicatum]